MHHPQTRIQLGMREMAYVQEKKGKSILLDIETIA